MYFGFLDSKWKKKKLQFAGWKVNISAYFIADIFEAVYNTQKSSLSSKTLH